MNYKLIHELQETKHNKTKTTHSSLHKHFYDCSKCSGSWSCILLWYDLNCALRIEMTSVNSSDTVVQRQRRWNSGNVKQSGERQADILGWCIGASPQCVDTETRLLLRNSSEVMGHDPKASPIFCYSDDTPACTPTHRLSTLALVTDHPGSRLTFTQRPLIMMKRQKTF